MVFPNDETGEVLKGYVEKGSDLSKPMEIDFFVAIPSKEAGVRVIEEVEELGFKTSVEFDDETNEWTCYCTKTIIPNYSEIIEIEKKLSLIAQTHGGYADGFGSYGNAG